MDDLEKYRTGMDDPEKYPNCDSTYSGADVSRYRTCLQASHMNGAVREWDHIAINPNGGTLHVGAIQSINSVNALQVNGRIVTNDNFIAGGTIYAQSTLNGSNFNSSALFTNGAVWATGKITSEDIIQSTSTNASTSTTTGAIRSSGGLGIVGNAYIGGTLNVAGSSALAAITASSIVLTNDITSQRGIFKAENNQITFIRASDANNITVFSTNSSLDGSMTIDMQATTTYWSRVLSIAMRETSGTQGGGRLSLSNLIRGTSALDLGTKHSPCSLIIQQTNNLVGSNQIGTSAQEMTLTSAMPSGFKFYSNLTTGASAPEALGNLIYAIDAVGNVRASANTFSDGGIHSKGVAINTALQNLGPSAHLHYGSNKVSLFGYDYNPIAVWPWKDVEIGNAAIFIRDSDSTTVPCIGIGISSGANYPIHITRTVSISISGYGWLNNTGTAGFSSSSGGNVPVSIYSTGRIVASEFNANSDKRIKENVEDVKIEHAMRFINEVSPKRYNLKGSTQIDYGYIAQDILACTGHALDDLVTLHKNDDLEGCSCNSDCLCFEPSGLQLSISYLEIIPLIHKALKNTIDRVVALESAKM